MKAVLPIACRSHDWLPCLLGDVWGLSLLFKIVSLASLVYPLASAQVLGLLTGLYLPGGWSVTLVFTCILFRIGKSWFLSIDAFLLQRRKKSNSKKIALCVCV